MIIAVFISYFLYYQHASFRSGRFGYHDLGLINDFLGNTAYGRGFFSVSQTGQSHLGVHFTPTLALLAPFWGWIDSPEILLWISVLATLWGVECAARLVRDMLQLDGGVTLVGPLAGHGRWLTWGVILAFAFNPYVKEVALSAHFEPLFFAFAMWTLSLAWRGAALWRLAGPFALALGVRQDAGLFLSFGLASLHLLPKAARSRALEARRARTLKLAGVALLYSLLAIFVVLPLFGGSSDSHVAKFWGRYGSTGWQVMEFCVRYPGIVAREIFSSGFIGLQESGGLLGFLSPVTLLVSHLPGVMLFIADPVLAPDKHRLLYYNSAFLLPGFFTAVGGGLVLLRWNWLRGLGVAAALAVSLSGFFASATNPLRMLPRTDLMARIEDSLGSCSAAVTVAGPPELLGFVPNRYRKVWLDRAAGADLVLDATGRAQQRQGLCR